MRVGSGGRGGAEGEKESKANSPRAPPPEKPIFQGHSKPFLITVVGPLFQHMYTFTCSFYNSIFIGVECGLNVYVAPKFLCQSPNSSVMVSGDGTRGSIRFRGGHEGGAHVVGLVVL